MSIEEMIGKENIAKGKYWRLPLTLVSGCTRCSPGCDHCWALTMERRFKKLPTKKWPESEIELSPIQIHPERLDIPLKRKKPTVWAIWNDGFHEDVPNDFIDQALGIIAMSARHTFLVLTKRIKRAKKYFEMERDWKDKISLGAGKVWGEEADCWAANAIQGCLGANNNVGWPMKNLWLGVTVCNQQEADFKIPLLLQIPAAVHFVSYEPALGPILIKWWLDGNHESGRKPSWLICGGESGPGARPMHPDWARSVRDQCQAAGVPFFFKQWGEWHKVDIGPLGRINDFSPPLTKWVGRDGLAHEYVTGDSGGEFMRRVGKKVAGRLLNGREWSELPEVKISKGV